jgi:hypothetical protein
MMNDRQQGRRGDAPRRARRLVVRIDSRRIRRLPLFVLALWLLSNPPATLARDEGTAEYPVKLAFLYNFTKFVEWPSESYPDPGAPFAICVVGDDPFSPDMKRELGTRTIGGHPVEVRTLKATDSLSACHVVFVPSTQKDQAARIVSGLKGSSTLTVGETEGFALQGGIINLTIEENKVHFEVNPQAAKRAGLTISSQLLKLATIVQE